MFKVLVLLSALAGGPQPGTLLAQGYIQGQPYTFEARSLPLVSPLTKKRIILEDVAAGSFVDLLTTAAQDGLHIEVNYGYRSHQEQKNVKRWMSARGKGNLVARPGWSTHESGLSVDIKGCLTFVSDERLEASSKLKKSVLKWHKMGACERVDTGYQCKTELYWWLRKNAPRFGFYNDVESEPWHWTYDSPPGPIEVGG